MSGPINREPFRNKLKTDVENIPVTAVSIAELRSAAQQAFAQQEGEVKLFTDPAGEADLTLILEQANREGLDLDDLKAVIMEVRRHVSVQANFDATRAHENQRTAAGMNIFKHIALNFKDGATLLGGGVASDVRKNEATIGGNANEVKALLEGALELGIMRRRLKRYVELGGKKFAGVLDELKTGNIYASNLYDTHTAYGKTYEEGLNTIISAIAIEAGPGKMFDVDGLGSIEVIDNDTKLAIQHHLKFVLRTEIIKLVEAEQLTVLSSEEYHIAHPKTTAQKAWQVGKGIVSSGTFWGVATRTGGRLALGGAIGAAGLAGGTAIIGGMVVGAGAGVAAAYIRERVNAKERLKRRKLEAALGAIDDELVKPASEINKELADAVRKLQTAPDAAAKLKALREAFKVSSDAQQRLQEARRDKQDYISFGVENRFKAQKELLDNIEKTLSSINGVLETLDQHLQTKLRSELVTLNGDIAGQLMQAKEHFTQSVSADESRRRTRSAIIGGLAGGFGSLAAHYVLDAMNGEVPTIATGAAPAEVSTPAVNADLPPVEATAAVPGSTPDAEVPVAPTIPPIEPVTATAQVAFADQIFLDDKTAKMLDAMGLQKGELQYDPTTKLFQIPDGALRDVAGKAEYLGQTEAWRARRLEFILKAMAEGKGTETPEMIVARAERATSNLLLTKGGLHDNPQAAFDEAFSKDPSFIQRNVMPWVDGTRSRISSRWMHLVAEMKHPVSPDADGAVLGAPVSHIDGVPDSTTPLTAGEQAVQHGASAAAESFQDFAIDQQVQKLGLGILGITGGIVSAYGAREQLAHDPERRNEFAGDNEHTVPETQLKDIDDTADDIKKVEEERKKQKLEATKPERQRVALAEIKKAVVDAKAAVQAEVAVLKPIIDAITSGASIDATMINELVAHVGGVTIIGDEVTKAQAVLAKEEPDFKYLDLDKAKNGEGLQQWVTEHAGFANIETSLKDGIDQIIRGIAADVTETRKKDDSDLPPANRKQQLETVLLPKLDLVNQVAGLVPTLVTDMSWPYHLEAQRDQVKAEIEQAVLMINFQELFGANSKVKPEVMDHLTTAGVLDATDMSLPAKGKAAVIKKLMAEVAAKSYTSDKAGLIAMKFMKNSMTNPVGTDQKLRIKTVLDRLVAGDTDIFRD